MSEARARADETEPREAASAQPAEAGAPAAAFTNSEAAALGRAGRAPPPLTRPAVLALQRSVGNAAVSRLLREPAEAPARPSNNLAGLPPEVVERIREREREQAGSDGKGEGEASAPRGEVDRSKLAAERGPLESKQKAAAPKPEQKLGEVTAAANAAKQAAEAPAAAPAGAGPAAPPPMPAAPAGAKGDSGAKHQASAAAANSAAEAVTPPDEPPPVAAPAPVVVVDAGGEPLPGGPEAETTTGALLMKAQMLREQGHALRTEAAGELAGAHALGAEIAESRAGVAQAEEAIGKSREGLEVRRSVNDQAKQALRASEQKQAMVAEKAPELSAKAAEEQAGSQPVAGEASDMAGQSKAGSARADDEEAAGKANEQGSKLTQISDQVGSIDETFGQSKTKADSLAQEAAEAKAANAGTAAKVAETDATVAQTDAKLGELDAKNQEARARLDSFADGPAQQEQGAREVDQTGQSLVEASMAIEQRIAAAAENHRAGMAAVPAHETPAAGGGSGGGPGGTLARTVEQRYEERYNPNLAGGLAELVGPTALAGTGAAPPSAEARRQAAAAEQARRQAEVDEINAMCDGHFERLTPGQKALHALKLTGRHLWNGVTETKWPQFVGHLVQGLIDPRISLMGIVSGLSMVLSGVGNIGNAQAWKTDPIGNALKIGADIATGITIVLVSVVGLATAILALAWALAIVTLGAAGGVAAALTPICTSVISTVFPWTIVAAKWAAAFQGLLFIKNLIDAATATSATDLQNQSDQMSEDAKQGLGMVAVIAVAKGGQAAGKAIANTRFGAAVGRGVQATGERFKIYPTGGAGPAAAAPAGGSAAAAEAGAAAEANAGARPAGGSAAAAESGAAAEANAGPRPAGGSAAAAESGAAAEANAGARPAATETPPVPRRPGAVEPVEPEGCFVAGTPVLTPDGPRPIESLAQGDLVLAGRPGDGDVPQRVRRTWTHSSDTVLDLAIDGAMLTCTGAHPFWVRGEWRPAAQLTPGDVLTTAGGGSVEVEAVNRRAGRFTVYNLAVAGLETYFVGGGAGVLVHNKSARYRGGADTPELAEARAATTRELETLHTKSETALRQAEALRRPDLARQLRELRENLEALDSNVQGANSRADLEGLDSWRQSIADELQQLRLEIARATPGAVEAPEAPTEPPLDRLKRYEANGQLQGEVADLKKRLGSSHEPTRLGAEAELLELEGQIRAGETPTVRGGQPGTDQAGYEVKARTEPFTNEKNLRNSFAGHLKAANEQFVKGNTRGEVRINLGEHVNLAGDAAQPITTQMVRDAVAQAVSRGGRATNVTRVIVRTGDGTVVYEGMGE